MTARKRMTASDVADRLWAESEAREELRQAQIRADIDEYLGRRPDGSWDLNRKERPL